MRKNGDFMIKEEFKSAKPVWLEGSEKEVNKCIELICKSKEISNGILKITGATCYQVFADGKIIHYGPARKAEGFSAMDILRLSEVSEILIRVMGYNCRSFAGITKPSFIQAEIEKDGEVVAATGTGGFENYDAIYHKQKVMRYSYQRYFVESYDYNQYRKPIELSEVSAKDKLVYRKVPYGEYKYIKEEKFKSGKWEYTNERRFPLFEFLDKPDDNFTHFLWEELDSHAYDEYLKIKCDYNGNEHSDVRVSKGECRLYDFEKIEAGFIRLRVKIKKPARIFLAFSEQLNADGRPAMNPTKSVNVIEWILPVGEYDLITIEAYSLKYAEVIVTDGEAEIDYVGICEVAFPSSEMNLNIPEDSELAEIYMAAAKTFRHNTIDIFMDCPSRERAGWLCDTFYTARAEYYFTGKTTVEGEFLNNYLQSPYVVNQKGMVNMCYPADVFSGSFIPQWVMWYVLEIDEYINSRRGVIDGGLLKKQFYDILTWFEENENEYGLLEDLDGWNFVEWSAVNNRVYNVSYPTNMLYAKMLEVIGRIYNRDDIKGKADVLRKKIREMAFDGKLFCDRAVRTHDGELENTDERSEVTQYYALISDTADISDDTFSYMRHMVLDVFGPNRKDFTEIEFADSMPGLYMRMDLLIRWGRYEQLLDEIRDYFTNMARETGTLWERYEGKASRDHGFTSYVAVAIDKAIKELKG